MVSLSNHNYIVGDLAASDLRLQMSMSVLHIASCTHPKNRSENHLSHALQYSNCNVEME